MQESRLAQYAAGAVLLGGLYLLVRPASLKTTTTTHAPAMTTSAPSTLLTVTPAPAPDRRTILIAKAEAAIKQEIPVRPATETPTTIHQLAVYLVDVCQEQGYPLDLAFGHCLAESSLALNAMNPGSGARGPFQMTWVACQEIGVPWPLPIGQKASVRAGILYMKHLRQTYAECKASVKTTLQHYGLGRGNWLNLKQNGCGSSPCANKLSVWRAECGCGRGYSSLIISVAKRHPELKTVAWWG